MGRVHSIQQRAPRGSSSILANQAKRNDLRARNIQLRERGERTETDPQITPGEIERLKAFERLTSIDRPSKHLARHRKIKSDGKLDTHIRSALKGNCPHRKDQKNTQTEDSSSSDTEQHEDAQKRNDLSALPPKSTRYSEISSGLEK